MEFPPDFSSGHSPRKQQLQGPRPTPLKVRKDSHKIRKPPVPPQPASQQPQAPPRPPVIIYTVSPKVIHANPSEFMNLVQRLTGPGPTFSSSSASSSSANFHDTTGGISPAARFASLEKIRSPEAGYKKKSKNLSQNDLATTVVGGIEIRSELERTSGFFPGILSPNPASLPPIPSNFFSPPSTSDPLGFLHDLSPVLHSNRNYLESSFIMPSPSNNFISPRLLGSPTTPSLDLFNNFFDL